MKLTNIARLLVASLVLISATALSVRAQNGYGRDPNQPIDDEYTKKIAEYTTEKFFNSPLTDYLPASPNVPTGLPSNVAPSECAQSSITRRLCPCAIDMTASIAGRRPPSRTVRGLA